MVRVAALTYDPRINREISQPRVDQMSSRFEPEALGVITVSERVDGSFVVIDGQHRVATLRQLHPEMNGHRIEARVFRGLSLAEEARLFVELNNTRLPHPLQRYLKGVTANDPRLCAIDSVVKAAGLRVDQSPGEGHIRCVAALAKAYDNYGEKHLAKVLSIVTNAWGRTDQAVTGSLVEGISLFLGRYTDRVDVDRLTTKLAAHGGGASGLLGHARGSKSIHGSSMANNVAAVVTTIYNKGRRANALPNWWTK